MSINIAHLGKMWPKMKQIETGC